MKQKIRKIFYYIILVLALFNLLIWDKALIQRQKNLNNITINFLDVGQGDAILIQTPDSQQILIDSGPNYENLQDDLKAVMPTNDNKIETIILTHPDQDHLAGFLDLIQEYDIELILDNQFKHDSNLSKNWREKIKNKNVKSVYAGESLEYKIEDNLIFELKFLWPINPDQLGTIKDANETSIVAKLNFENQSFLLTGDAGIETEEELLEIYSEESLESEVLKAGHHGSKNSSDKEFIKIINPDYSIISCGADNTYGHPHSQVLDNLKKSNILRTDEVGRITFAIQNNNVKIICEKQDCSEFYE